MKLELQGKVALVTGGSRGIGAAICRGLAAEGVRVGVGCSGSPEKAAEVVAGIARDFGTEAVALRADLERAEEIAGMFDRLEERFGAVDILVNNAAYCPGGPIEMYSLEEGEDLPGQCDWRVRGLSGVCAPSDGGGTQGQDREPYLAGGLSRVDRTSSVRCQQRSAGLDDPRCGASGSPRHQRQRCRAGHGAHGDGGGQTGGESG